MWLQVAHVNVLLDLVLVVKHLKVHLVLQVQPHDVLLLHLTEIFSCCPITRLSSTTTRASMNSTTTIIILITRLVDGCEVVPVITVLVEIQFIKQPISIFVKGFQFQDGIVTNVTRNANLWYIC